MENKTNPDFEKHPDFDSIFDEAKWLLNRLLPSDEFGENEDAEQLYN